MEVVLIILAVVIGVPIVIGIINGIFKAKSDVKDFRDQENRVDSLLVAYTSIIDEVQESTDVDIYERASREPMLLGMLYGSIQVLHKVCDIDKSELERLKRRLLGQVLATSSEAGISMFDACIQTKNELFFEGADIAVQATKLFMTAEFKGGDSLYTLEPIHTRLKHIASA